MNGGVQVGLEIRQPELRRVPAVHDVGGVGDDADGHGDGVEGDGDATVVDIAVPEARSPTTFDMHFCFPQIFTRSKFLLGLFFTLKKITNKFSNQQGECFLCQADRLC